MCTKDLSRAMIYRHGAQICVAAREMRNMGNEVPCLPNKTLGATCTEIRVCSILCLPPYASFPPEWASLFNAELVNRMCATQHGFASMIKMVTDT